MEQASLATARAPREEAPTPAWAAAITRHREGDTAGAILMYQRHLKRNPQDVAGWMTLASALRSTRRFDAALVCCQRALRLRPLDAAVWSNLGSLWLELGQHEQSLRAHRRALELDPSRFELRVNHARALCEACRFVEAEAVLDECLDSEPGRADLRMERALLRLQCGRYREAWPDFEARAPQAGMPQRLAGVPRWRGERIGGKHLLLSAEHGAAGVIWAARYIRMLTRRGADLTLLARGSLHPMLAGQGVRLLEPEEVDDADLHFDFHCPVLSLPGLVDPLGHSIPEPLEVEVPEAARTAMQRRVTPYSDALRIGIAWSGSTRAPDHAHTAVALARFLPLAMLPGVQLFSLQKGAPAAELQLSGAAGFVVDLGAQCAHFGDTAAALEQMDLAIVTDGPVAHLAGTLGMPVLNLVRFRPDWIYGLRGESTPWYPTMRLVRQPEPGNWGAVFDEVQRLTRGWSEVRMRQRRSADPGSRRR